MAPVLLAGTATLLFAIALLLFGIGGADRFVIGAVLAGLLALSFAVLARFAEPRRRPLATRRLNARKQRDDRHMSSTGLYVGLRPEVASARRPTHQQPVPMSTRHVRAELGEAHWRNAGLAKAPVTPLEDTA